MPKEPLKTLACECKQEVSDIHFKLHRLERECADLKMIMESLTCHLDGLINTQEHAVNNFIDEVKPQINHIRTILSRLKR